MRPVVHALILALSGVVGVSAAPGARAAAKPAAPVASQPAYATRDQLRACLAGEDALDARHAQIEQAGADHAAALAQYDAEGAKLADVEAQLDHGSEAAVHAYNLRVADHNAHGKVLNDEASDFRIVTDAFNADALAQNRRCGTLVYRAEDMAAVQQARRAADE